jgi:membrane protein YdbS with pleckstrin-like domain
MTETFMRHFIAVMGTLIALAIFLGGYFSGKNGWWWAGFGVAVVYIIVYKLVKT